MCGIAGIIMKDGVAVRAGDLRTLQSALAHRGPDGMGEYVRGNIGLVHTRLAIIDPEGGQQPLYGNGIVLVGNGEIYNYIELKKDLPPADYKTGSDFEPVMQMLTTQGMESLTDIRGMYAIITHAADGKIVIARDRYGIKPLYTVETPEFMAFASEARALLALPGVEKNLMPEKVSELLSRGYVTGAETVYKKIQRILPGEVLKNKQISKIPTLPSPQKNQPSFDSALKQFDALFENSVELHQRSDVPYGLFLSGGLDSTAVLTMMARLNSAPVTTFTCGFDAPNARDERDRARQTATALGADYHEILFGEKDFWNTLPRVAAALDDPIVDYAALPTYLLAAEAKKTVKVVLSGEGGDEALAGYGRYRKAARPWFLGGGYQAKGRFENMSVLLKIPLSLEGEGTPKAGERGVKEHAHSNSRTPLSHPHVVRAPSPSRERENYSKLQRAQAHDFAGWLPDNLLIKLDRCLMAHGVEGRTPFLEPNLTDFCFNLPDDFKIQNGLGKHLLRVWLQQHGPKDMDYFSKKLGFTVPVGDWISARGPQLAPLMAAQECIREIAYPDAVKNLFTHLGSRGGKRESIAAWTLLFYACWHKIHIQDARADRDVFALLS